MTFSGAADRRRAERFHIDCAMTLAIRDRGKMLEIEPSCLCDIGAYGARFCASTRLKPGTRVTLHVNFPSARHGVTTIRFEGIVTRAQEQHETAVEFDRPGKFLKRRFELLRPPAPTKPKKPRDADDPSPGLRRG